MRHTRAHTRNRRSHHALKQAPITTDENGVVHMRHRASQETGSYRGRQVIDVAKAAEKKLKRQQAKENEQTK